MVNTISDCSATSLGLLATTAPSAASSLHFSALLLYYIINLSIISYNSRLVSFLHHVAAHGLAHNTNTNKTNTCILRIHNRQKQTKMRKCTCNKQNNPHYVYTLFYLAGRVLLVRRDLLLPLTSSYTAQRRLNSSPSGISTFNPSHNSYLQYKYYQHNRKPYSYHLHNVYHNLHYYPHSKV